jgi:hypothetical protein
MMQQVHQGRLSSEEESSDAGRGGRKTMDPRNQGWIRRRFWLAQWQKKGCIVLGTSASNCYVSLLHAPNERM